MKVAWQKAQINPPLPTYMEGYVGGRKSQVIHDDIEAHVLIMANQEKYFVLISLDIILIDKAFGLQLRTRLSRESGIAVEQIAVIATHTHSGPQISTKLSSGTAVNQDYLNEIEDTVSKVFTDCLKSLTPVQVYCKEVSIGIFYSNRNQPDLPYNEKAQFVRFIDEQGATVVDLMNFNCHPTILKADNLEISADLVGSIRQHYRDNLMIVLGEAGDVSTRFKRQGEDFAEVDRVGRGIAERLTLGEWQALRPSGFDLKTIIHEVSYDPASDLFLNNAKAQLEKAVSQQPEARVLLDMVEERLAQKSGTLSFEASIFSLGSLVFVFFPSEIVFELGKILRDVHPNLILVAYTNDFRGYAVDQATYGKFGESLITDYPYGEADAFVKKIAEQIEVMMRD
ncbi:hypothetical protein [Streptococcus merionis]|uniref:hypothetical protein n=1 Tax=Streptococcus merionis TaxID=400065 RepID=UPI0026EA1921|nr:hypothetical protein [Streptococcus merionis]